MFSIFTIRRNELPLPAQAEQYNPYLAARREWDERYGDQITRAKNSTGRAFSAVMGLERTLATGGGFMASRSDALARHRRLREAGLGLIVAHPRDLSPSLASELIRGAGKPGFMPATPALEVEKLAAEQLGLQHGAQRDVDGLPPRDELLSRGIEGHVALGSLAPFRRSTIGRSISRNGKAW